MVLLKSDRVAGNSGTGWIDVSLLPSGIYFLNIVGVSDQASLTIIKI